MSNLKNRRIALHHAVAMAVSDRFQTEREVVSAAKAFADFLNDDAALSVTEVDAAKIVERVKERVDESVSAYNFFANTCIVEMGLKGKTVAKLADFLKEAGGYMNGDIADVVAASPEILDGLGKKRALEFVSAVCNTADNLGLDPKEAIFSILEEHMDLESAELEEAKMGWSTLIAFARAEDSEVCPGCGQVHDEMPMPTPDALVRDFMSKPGADLLNSKGVETFADLINAGPVVMLDMPAVDVQYLHDAFSRALSRPGAFVPMTCGYSKLPLDSFADVHPTLVEYLNDRGIRTLADMVSGPESLDTFVSLASMPTFVNLVGHMVTALTKEVEENAEIDPARKAEVIGKLEALKSMLSRLTHLKTNAAIRRMKAVDELRDHREAQESANDAGPAESEDQIKTLLDAYIGKYPGKMQGDAVVVNTDLPEGAALFKALRDGGKLKQAPHPLQDLLDSLFAARSTRH